MSGAGERDEIGVGLPVPDAGVRGTAPASGGGQRLREAWHGVREAWRRGWDAVPLTARLLTVVLALLLARLDEQRPGRGEPVDLAVLANDAVHEAAATSISDGE